MLEGLMNAGFLIVGTWPLRTERPTGVKVGTNALASSIVLVCRPRPADATTVTRKEFLSALRRELRSHKVPDSVIDEVLAEVDSQDTLMAAVEQVHGRVARCAIPLSRKDEHRLVAFLMRRGHDYDLAREAIALAVEEVTAASGSS